MTSYRNNRSVVDMVKISPIDAIASFSGRYGLVVVIGWIGALKFMNFEAHPIQPLVANSPHGLAVQHLPGVRIFCITRRLGPL